MLPNKPVGFSSRIRMKISEMLLSLNQANSNISTLCNHLWGKK